MLYILETKLSEKKAFSIALSSVYGLGNKKANLISKKLGFSSNLKVNKVTRIQINEFLKLMDSIDIPINNELKKKKNLNIKVLISIKSYRGLRTLAGLPVRGQRTHTNSKSARKMKYSY